MAVRVSHTNNSSGHDGTYVYRSTSPMDPQNLPTPIADEPPVPLGATFEYIDSESLPDGTYYYRTQDHEGGQVSAASGEHDISFAPDYASAQIGETIGGGIYAGDFWINGVRNHLIAGDSSSETSLAWRDTTGVTNVNDPVDGEANMADAEAFGGGFLAFDYCRSYNGGGLNDWYLPSKEEILFVRNALFEHSEFLSNTSSDGYTWTSTEATTERDPSSFAWTVRFSDGYMTSWIAKTSAYRVRPLRRIEVPSDPGKLQIGDAFEGGIYAGIDTIDGVDYHIIAGDAASEAYGKPYKLNRNDYPTYADSETDGLANTVAMQSAGIAEHPAAEHCVNYSGGGYTDWHMPANTQVQLIRANLAGHPDFRDNYMSEDYTWTSTHRYNSYGWKLRFSDGDFSGGVILDDTRLRTRPIRRVAV